MHVWSLHSSGREANRIVVYSGYIKETKSRWHVSKTLRRIESKPFSYLWKEILGRGKSKYKGPRAEYLEDLRNRGEE